MQIDLIFIRMAPTKLQIKTKAFERLLKEKGLYETDIVDQEKALKEKSMNGSDCHEIKKLNEVLEESKKMSKELASKIADHRQRLHEFLESYNGEEDTGFARQLLSDNQ